MILKTVYLFLFSIFQIPEDNESLWFTDEIIKISENEALCGGSPMAQGFKSKQL